MKKFRDSMVGSVIILGAISFVIVLALALTNYVTKPLIDTAAQETAQEARLLVLPEADDFTKLEGELPEKIKEGYRANNGTGYVFEVEDSGYGGAMSFMVGMNENAEFTGVTVLSHNETPGLGTRVLEDEYMNQFIGLSDPNEVDDVTSATVSSLTLKRAMDNAVEGFDFATRHLDETTGASVSTEDVENPTEEENNE